MTLTIETGRRLKVATAAYRARHHALNMGEAQGQGYIGQALGAADMLASVYADQLRYRPAEPEVGRTGTGSYCPPVTTPSGCTRRSPRRALSP